ncbi:hypothetical protein [Portibacter marinus]|uniref:hypothetical protein n=1 Tax=Portibacter marinus TaxID=2898660 RepID=UPI001F482491|nr:hypothetical protein [Portibacter marinus]
MKNFTILTLTLTYILISCISYDEKTEQKYQQNKAYIESYLEQIGYAENPFLIIIPEEEMDKQRKKRIALMSEEELKTLIDQKAMGVPRIKHGTPESEQFLNEVKDFKDPAKRYKVLTEKYPDLIISN